MFSVKEKIEIKVISLLQGKKSRVSFKSELFCLEIKTFVPKRI